MALISFSGTERHRNCRLSHGRRSEHGWILLTLLLMFSLIIIAAAAIVPTISFEIRRDREEELIHRGVQYSRAIRAFYKKFGRYPMRLEELESSNNLRFLRKRYKDPITGQDFKLLHYGEVKMALGGGIAGANSIGTPVSAMNGSQSSSGSAFGGNSSSFGGNASSFGNSGGFGGNSGTFGGNSGGLGGNSNGTFFSNSNSSASSSSAPSSQQTTNSSTSAGSDSQPQTTGQGSDAQSGNTTGSSSSSGQSGNQTFGGAPIVGVVSTSKKEGIREFNHKRKYEEWQFIYDPSLDRGGLLNTPAQPPLQGFANLNPNQQNPNQSNSPFGSSGIQSTPNQMSPGGFNNTPTPPSTTNSPQQQ